MIIPDDVRQNYLQNLIGGLAMNLEGPPIARLIFHGFCRGCGHAHSGRCREHRNRRFQWSSDRVSEDGVLTEWFRQPHPRFESASLQRCDNPVACPKRGCGCRNHSVSTPSSETRFKLH